MKVRMTLSVKLMLAFVLPTVTVFSLFAFVAYKVQRDELEAELGRRLEAVASAAATRIRGKYLVDLSAGDEEEDLYYSGALKRLSQVQAATEVERIYLFDRDYNTKVDTSGTPIGAKQFQAEIDRRELLEVFSTGRSASSLLFEGIDGRSYKAGYAALYRSDEKAEVVLAVGADAPADFFERLSSLRQQLVLYGLLLVFAVAVVAVLVAMRITRPVRSLAEAAGRIGAGDLDAPILPTSKDEIGLLAETMDQMRADLQTRDERMQLMLAGIAHEVRNPLGGIELFSGILREELEDDPEKRSHVERIDKEIGHLKTVVENFLDYARRPDLVLQPVNLAALIREVADLEAGRVAKASLELKLELEAVTGCADAEQLRRALLNLLRNAIEAGKGSGRPVIVVLDEDPSGWARIRVRNYGAEIEQKIQERLFEPFFTTKQKGTGLGLAFVREIAFDHGGSIEVQSNTSDGTCFTLRVPTATSA